MSKSTYLPGPAVPYYPESSKREAVKNLALVCRRWLNDRATSKELEDAVNIWSNEWHK